MQFLPTKSEKYVSALRKYMHKNIILRGVTANRLKILRKIYLFDLCCSDSFRQSADALILCRDILTECSVELIKKGIFMTVDIWGDGIKNIDIKAFTALLCEMVAHTATAGEKTVSLCLTEKEIRITSKGEKLRGYPLKLIKKLGGRYFVLENTNAISIPALSVKCDKITELDDIKTKLTDPLSPVKVYLSVVESRYFV